MMIEQPISTFKNFKKKNKFSLTYLIENNVGINKIELLINNILTKENSFIFESVEKAKTRGRYTIFGFKPDLTLEIKNKKILINKKKYKKKTKQKNF